MATGQSYPPMPDRSIRRLLVACRGEPALRVMASARRLGVETVALFGVEDAEAEWVEVADYAVYVPEEDEPWPAIERVVAAGVDSGCDAVHPGWSQLCRSLFAAEMVVRAGLAWVGPSIRALQAVSDRTAQRAAARKLGIPSVPGSDPVSDLVQVRSWLAWAGTPALLKPVDMLGLPGRSLRIDDIDQVAELVEELLLEGPALLERLVLHAREVEVPVLAGGDGHVVALGDRETTVRSGLDRLLVEAPVAGLSDETRTTLARSAIALAQALGWHGVGAVRFLLTDDGRPWFLGLRPGLTSWHAATEAALQMDLVETELHLASGGDLTLDDPILRCDRHAIAVRLSAAEPGVLQAVAATEGVSIQPAVAHGDAVSAGDIVGTVAVSAPTRQAAIVRARALLDHWPLRGLIPEDAPLKALLNDPGYWAEPQHRERAAALTGLGRRSLPGRLPADLLDDPR